MRFGIQSEHPWYNNLFHHYHHKCGQRTLQDSLYLGWQGWYNSSYTMVVVRFGI